MIEEMITSWLVKSIETQGLTWGLFMVSFWWLTKRVEYLDNQISVYNKFMRDCLEKHIEPTEIDQFRGK